MTPADGPDQVAQLRRLERPMLASIEALVSVESPSDDPTGTGACADVLAELGAELLGSAPEHLDVAGARHLRWRFGRPRVLLLGHLDTVWPLGTLQRWPFEVRDGRATGPGVFDMKAGLVQGLYGLRQLDELDGVSILVTSDEEAGSPTSRELIEDTARGLDAVLVLEPSADGALKTGRKGVSNYHLEVRGEASHAGLEPERGINALVEAAHQVLAVERLARADDGTTVTPTRAVAGTAINVVPATATIDVDVRVTTASEQERVDQQMRALSPVAGARLTVSGGPNRPPLHPSSGAALFAAASTIAADLGLGELRQASVGGASDGNFTAGIGIPTLDGLGAVGGGAHAEGEYVEVAAIAERAALVGALVRDLLRA